MTGKVIDFNTRSVGDVPAPSDEECPNCGAHWPHDERSELSVKLATSVERNAVVKYLSEQALSGSWSKAASMVLVTVSARIRAGEHTK